MPFNNSFILIGLLSNEKNVDLDIASRGFIDFALKDGLPEIIVSHPQSSAAPKMVDALPEMNEEGPYGPFMEKVCLI